MLAPSDWSRFASYHAVITSYEVIIAGVLNCKVAALRFVNVSAEVVNVVEENAVAKSTKYALEFDGTLFKRGGEAYNDTNNHHNYSNNSFIYRIYNRIRKLLRNYTTIVIRFKLSEHCYIILFISPSANNCQVEEKVVNPRRTDRINKLRTKINTKRNKKLKKTFRKRTAPNATLRKLNKGGKFLQKLWCCVGGEC